jgi:hypothetical protein
MLALRQIVKRLSICGASGGSLENNHHYRPAHLAREPDAGLLVCAGFTTMGVDSSRIHAVANIFRRVSCFGTNGDDSSRPAVSARDGGRSYDHAAGLGIPAGTLAEFAGGNYRALSAGATLYARSRSQMAGQAYDQMSKLIRAYTRQPSLPPCQPKLIRLRREKYLEEALVAVDNGLGLAGADIESLLNRRRGAIPPAAAERLEQSRRVG